MFLKSFLGAEMSRGEGEEKNKTDPFLKIIYLVTTNEQRGKEFSEPSYHINTCDVRQCVK